MEWVRKHKYLIVFLFSMLNDFWFSFSAVSAVGNNMLISALTNLTYPFVSMIGLALFAEEETLKGKVKVAVVTGLGYMTGSIIFLLWLKDFLFGLHT